jgi:GGDEF domain-containing protein
LKYSRFELLALSVGSVSIAGAIFAAFRRGLLVEELIAQTLFLVVLVGAVHWGRKGGTLTAVIAVVAYAAIRAPLLIRESFSPDALELILIRTLTYSVVGIAGGELCGRVRYLLASVESNSNIDECTRLFNERFIAEMLRSMIGEYERYKTTFSVVALSLAESPQARLRPAMLRTVANQVRGDVRLVDDVAYLDDGRFLLVLPHTDKAGARIAADRVSNGVRRVLGETGDSVRAEVLGVVDDLAAIRHLCGAAETPDAISSEPGAAA